MVRSKLGNWGIGKLGNRRLSPLVTGHWLLVTGYWLLATGHCALPSFAQSEVLAIRAQKVITISGADITNGVVLVRDGKIAAVGQDVSIPPGARVLEANVVMPGMVEAHTARGMDAPNENVPVVPFVSTADGLDPLHFTFEDALRDGITTIHVIQGNNTVIGGTGVIMKP
ncbi:MAG: hypothetical protein NZT92_13310, partial [Abditibacteriales bacterium]|nr:hypothetical protein [Abditibacteriales bacterium]MDW8366939.1 hypothetical protein [Abditibacteriales bacterium]